MLDETSRYRFTRLLILGHPGKLAKLTAGEWDTHSDNSPSAVPIVEKLACEIFGEPAATAVAAVTVEGIFQSVGGDRQSKLADELSRRIRECVNHRLGGCPDSAVVLINMNGDILGSSGDLWPWR
jgi:cobalt-precorrin-5B (C1)-methyltransferase